MTSNYQIQSLPLASCALNMTPMTFPLAPVLLHDLCPGYLSNLMLVSLPSSTTMRLPFFLFLKYTKDAPSSEPLYEVFPLSSTFFCHVALWPFHHESGLSLNLTSHQILLGHRGWWRCSPVHIPRQPQDPEYHPLVFFKMPISPWSCSFLVNCLCLLTTMWTPENRHQVRLNHGASPRQCHMVGPQELSIARCSPQPSNSQHPSLKWGMVWVELCFLKIPKLMS